MNENPASTARPAPALTPPPATLGEHAAELTPARIVEIVQTVLTGLILALIMRAFLVEPFIIPTGSMADTLLGAHATRTCPACGWEYDYAPRNSDTATPTNFVCPLDAICPNCHGRRPVQPETTIPKAGDRILVHKWAYALGGPLGPRRWDVIVFRSPADPMQHFIKRLVGLPGETVEIIAGDLYINGQIARKPPAVQRGLWFVVFDQAHLPAAADSPHMAPRWAPRDAPAEGGVGWSGLDSRVLHYDGLDAVTRRLEFDRYAGSTDYLLDFYAYDRQSSGSQIGDLRIQTELTFSAGDGACEFEITRPPYRFRAEFGCAAGVTLHVESLPGSGPPTSWTAHAPAGLVTGRPATVEFAHVDYRVYVSVAGCEVLSTTDAEYTPPLHELRMAAGVRPISLALSARNLRLDLRNLRIDRDVYYTSQSADTRRADPGHPFTLEAGEYFVLGDNSPGSYDSRKWTEAGPHLPADYRPGTVRADQIVGQAAFVYLPGLLPLEMVGRWSVPDLGRVRFVR